MRLLFNEFKRTIVVVKGTSEDSSSCKLCRKCDGMLPKRKKEGGCTKMDEKSSTSCSCITIFSINDGKYFFYLESRREFSVSKQKNLVVQNDTVIVPAGEVVKGDVVVRNGKLKIEGEVQGDVTVINGEQYLASAGHVTGQIEEVNEVFDWIWYHMKKTAYEVVDIFQTKDEE